MHLLESLLHGGKEPVLLLLVQVALVLGLCRFISWIANKVHQPQVVGEMIAGLMLGPSLFGWLFPNAAAMIFPAQSIGYLNALSQIGVIYFLFLVGLELDPKLLKNRGHAAVIISHISIILPFLLGAVLALVLYTRLFNHTPQMHFRSVALFMGAAMSITAFPVLARILTERNLHKTRVGAVAITCAAVDDVTAWCMLAFVIGIARAQGIQSGIRTAILAAVYVVVMYFVVRPFLKRLQLVFERTDRLSSSIMGSVFLMVLISAYITEIIGIHALFGAFLLGAMMPKGSRFVHTLTEKLEDFTVLFLLPIFFAYTGLKTRIGVLDNPEMWLYCGLVICVACLGKFGGSTLAARACGIGWREAGAIGILMNTRGLMELVILNVGRELGVITDAVFAMMVLMALVTTALTTPILHLVYPQKKMEEETIIDTSSGYTVLIPVSLPSSGASLLRLAAALTGSKKDDGRVVALYLKRPEHHDAYRIARDPAPEEIEALQPLMHEAKERNVLVSAVTFTSRDVASDISRTARLRHVDLILMGFHNPVYTSSILGGTVHRVLTGSDTDVAVLVDRGFASPKNVLVPFAGSKHDRLAMELTARMARVVGVHVTVLHVTHPKAGGDSHDEAKAATDRVFNDPGAALPITMRTIESHEPVETVIEEAKAFDLIVIGVSEQWGLESQLLGFRAERIAREVASSLLIVRKRSSHRAARGIEADHSTTETKPRESEAVAVKAE